jgi:hypothetical protein
MLGLAGIEILIGLTALGTLLATGAFFIGSSKEQKIVETESERSNDDSVDVKVLEPEVASTTTKEPDGGLQAVPGKIENEESEPVMALLQESDSEDKSELPEMPNIDDESDLPPIPAGSEQVEGEELERQIVEKQLQRIADKRAEQKTDVSIELPAMTAPPKISAENSAPPPIPKPFLHELPQPSGEKPVLPALPKPERHSPPIPKPLLHELPQPSGEKPVLPALPNPEGGLSPIPRSANLQDETDLPTVDKDDDG